MAIGVPFSSPATHFPVNHFTARLLSLSQRGCGLLHSAAVVSFTARLLSLSQRGCCLFHSAAVAFFAAPGVHGA